MGKGHMSKEEAAERDRFDERVKSFYDKGYGKQDIAIYLETEVRKVTYAINRIKLGKSMQKATNDSEAEARREAELLIDAKMAPINKPKVKLTRVDGWENGRYVHYTAYDVSEFLGL